MVNTSATKQVDCLGLDLDDSIAASSYDLKIVLLYVVRLGHLSIHSSLPGIPVHQARAWIVEANGVLDVIVDILCIDWHVDVIVLLLQGGEGRYDLALLVREQVCFLWSELDLVLVLVGHLPLVLERDP